MTVPQHSSFNPRSFQFLHGLRDRGPWLAGRVRQEPEAETLAGGGDHQDGDLAALVFCLSTWTSKMAKTMDHILPTVSILRYWAICWALLEVQVGHDSGTRKPFSELSCMNIGLHDLGLLCVL